MQGDLLALFTQGDQTSGFRLQPFLSSASSPIVYGTASPRSFSFAPACLDFDVCESPESRVISKEKTHPRRFCAPFFFFVLWTYLFLSLV